MESLKKEKPQVLQVVISRPVLIKKDKDKILAEYSSVSQYNDPKWIINRRYEGRNGRTNTYTIYFKNINKKFLENVRTIAIKKLMSRLGVRTIAGVVRELCIFYDFIYRNFSVSEDKYITQEMIYSYYLRIMKKNTAINTKAGILNSVKECFLTNEAGLHIYNSFEKLDIPKQRHRKNDAKLIPEEIVNQIDILMYETSGIPIYVRVLYWTLRLFPSRVEEICSIKLNCLNQMDNGDYELIIPTFKQSGQNKVPERRRLILKNEGIIAMYIELIKKQETISHKLQSRAEKHEKDFLFLYEVWGKEYLVNILKPDTVNRILKKICNNFKICDVYGKEYSLTSHQFRHNGITDRVESGIFRPIDIMTITKSKSIAMINDAYVHHRKDVMMAIQKKVNVNNEHEEKMNFKGHIIDTNNSIRLMRLLEKAYASQIGELGICGDSSNCESSMYDCLGCQSFVPDINNRSYFEQQKEIWKEKSELALINNNVFFYKKAYSNQALYQRLIDRICKDGRSLNE